jgi:hypothetical protein
MHKIILAASAALGLFSAAATAQKSPEAWVYAGMRGGAMGWEATAIKRDPAAGTASTLRFVYFTKPREGVKGDFTWVFQDIEFHCSENTFRLMNAAFYDKGRGGGEAERGSAAMPVRSNTPEYVLKQVLCDDALLSGARRASNMADAMDGAESVALP